MSPAIRSEAYASYVLALVFLVAVFNVCDRTIVSVLVDDIRADLALDDRQMGLVMGFAFSFTYLLAGIPLKRIGMFAGAGVAGIVLMYFTYANGRNRIDSFLSGGNAFDQVDLAQRTLLNGG